MTKSSNSGAIAVPTDTLVAVVGAHGGAGTTTVATLLRPAMALDLQTITPARWDVHAGRWATLPLVVVARGTARGTADAVAAVSGAAAVGLRPAALAVIGDGWWPEPAVVRARLRMLSGRVGAVVRVPYAPAWRYVDDPLAAAPSSRVDAAIERIRTALTHADGHTSGQTGWTP